MTITLSLMIAILYHMKSLNKLWLPNLIVMYIFFYSIGYGPIPWILMPQICPRKVSFKFQIYLFLNICNTVLKQFFILYLI